MSTTTYEDQTRPGDIPAISRPVQLNNAWATILAAGQVATEDNGGSDITNPDTEVDAGNTEVFDMAGRATLLAFALAYDDELTVSADPVLQVFGRKKGMDPADPWMRLKTIGGDIDLTLATAATDAEDGTLKYTTVDLEDTVVDSMGCDEVAVRVKGALAGTGDTENAKVLVKGL